MIFHLVIRNASQDAPDVPLLSSEEWSAMHRIVRSLLSNAGTCRLFSNNSFAKTVSEVVIIFEPSQPTIDSLALSDIMASLAPTMKRFGLDIVHTVGPTKTTWDMYSL